VQRQTGAAGVCGSRCAAGAAFAVDMFVMPTSENALFSIGSSSHAQRQPVEPASQINPISAIEHALPGATIKWSRIRTPIRDIACLSVAVSASSALDGCTVPLG
jgi:hypothetical protein